MPWKRRPGQQWRHGWIPLTPHALAEKMHRATGGRAGASAPEIHHRLITNRHYRGGYTESTRMMANPAHRDTNHHASALDHERLADEHLDAGRTREALHHAGRAAGHRKVMQIRGGPVDEWAPTSRPPAPKTAAEHKASRAAARSMKLDEYRVARHQAQLQQEEQTRGGGAADVKHYRDNIEKDRLSRGGKGRGVQPLTYRQWMKGQGQKRDD
jgi:hypothetical protein